MDDGDAATKNRHLSTFMVPKIIAYDFIGACFLFIGCVIGGLVLNELRPAPLPLVYSSRESRLNHALEHLGLPSLSPAAAGGDVDRDEMRKISSLRQALILDARPVLYYRLGHIPSALSLSRDDFEKRYRALQTTLTVYRDKAVVVYCSDDDCEDSQMVADALQTLGYAHVRVFRGGWSDWEGAHLPEEKE